MNLICEEIAPVCDEREDRLLCLFSVKSIQQFTSIVQSMADAFSKMFPSNKIDTAVLNYIIVKDNDDLNKVLPTFKELPRQAQFGLNTQPHQASGSMICVTSTRESVVYDIINMISAVTSSTMSSCGVRCVYATML